MNESRTVVATTTRTRPPLETDVVVVTRAFRGTPARLADGLGLGSVLRRDNAGTPQELGSPAFCEWRRTLARRAICPDRHAVSTRIDAAAAGYFLRRRTCMRMGEPTKPKFTRSWLPRKR